MLALLTISMVSAQAIAGPFAYRGMPSSVIGIPDDDGKFWRRNGSAACSDNAKYYFQRVGVGTICEYETGDHTYVKTTWSAQNAGFVEPQYCRINLYCGPILREEKVNPIRRVLAVNRLHTDKSCPANVPVSHPIYPLTGSKGLKEKLGDWLPGASVVASYETRLKVPALDGGSTFDFAAPPSFGGLWNSGLHKSLIIQNIGGGAKSVQAARGAGVWISFSYGSGSMAGDKYVADGNDPDQLQFLPSGAWRYIDFAAQAQENYDANGILTNVVYANGAMLNYLYSDSSTPANVAPVPGLLISVQDQSGRSVKFLYEQPAGAAIPRINHILDPAGQTVDVSYDTAGNLRQFKWPDNKTRQYLYERSDIPWALTGIIDENATRLATYGYDATGRATDTQWAGGVDHHSVSYATPPSWNIVETYDYGNDRVWIDHSWQAPQGITVTKPNGVTSSLGTQLVNGMSYLTDQSQPEGSGCTASTSHQAFDPQGNVTRKDDFNGNRTCYGNDLSRNLEITRVEGLAQAADCSGLIAPNAAIPAGSRKVSTQWHPDWRMVVKLAEPGRIVTSVYNGQPDPDGGTALCAPTEAQLPDKTPIAVLCKQVEQATTDTNGSKGFSAPLQAGVVNRVTSWTYDASGHVLTSKGPRTDVNDTTTYVYYKDPAADYMPGDLQQITNASNKTTQFTKYNKFGQVLESKDINGVLTVNTYDPRQRLKTVTVSGRQTKYDYDGVGQLKKVTQPDTSWIGFDYDDAHRQSAVYDHLGNRIEYTLDKLGNRTFEKVKDPGNVLKRQLQRSIDALGRVQQTTGQQ